MWHIQLTTVAVCIHLLDDAPANVARRLGGMRRAHHLQAAPAGAGAARRHQRRRRHGPHPGARCGSAGFSGSTTQR
jgi:hypothetical protein